jgi:hypothetical protein
MHKIDTPGNVANQFTDGNPGTGTPATVVDDDWLNAVQDELVNVVLDGGLSLVKATHTQVRDAIRALIARAPTQNSPGSFSSGFSTYTVFYQALSQYRTPDGRYMISGACGSTGSHTGSHNVATFANHPAVAYWGICYVDTDGIYPAKVDASGVLSVQDNTGSHVFPSGVGYHFQIMGFA